MAQIVAAVLSGGAGGLAEAEAKVGLRRLLVQKQFQMAQSISMHRPHYL